MSQLFGKLTDENQALLEIGLKHTEHLRNTHALSLVDIHTLIACAWINGAASALIAVEKKNQST